MSPQTHASLARPVTRGGLTATVIVVALLLIFPGVVTGDQFVTAAITALLGIFMVQCWNLAAGYAGLFSLGHSVFLGIGAYASTMLFVKADIHRDGLIFPPFPYGQRNPACRPGRGELETEGLGIMAKDMGRQCWGMPNLEIKHAPI